LPSTPTRQRLTFARFPEIQPVPDLIAIQRESFDWFLSEGLRETFRDMTPPSTPSRSARRRT